jgi:hypothetical protein
VPAIASGKPGVGAYATPAGNSIAKVELGPADVIAPATVNPQTIGTSVFPTSVEMQWQNPADDANGSGIWHYWVFRNGVFLTSTRPAGAPADIYVPIWCGHQLLLHE